jgi:diguanylate cyclase (GGDEF)-like protein
MKKNALEQSALSRNPGESEEPENGNLDKFYSDPKIIEHYDLLQEIGVFDQLNNLKKEIRSYRDLVSAGLDIINRPSLESIMDAAVFRISDHFLPSFITFLWKPIQTREEITIKSYENYRPADLGIRLHSIAPFEPFFRNHPQPIAYPLLRVELKDAGVLGTLEKLKPEIIVPMVGGFGLYGIILIGHKMLGDNFTGKEVLFIEHLMAFVTQAIMNYLNYQYSLRDVKTGLYNHGFFLQRLEEELSRIRRGRYLSSLLVMDVDKFKNFNDEFGHLAGDKVLEALAITLKQTVRGEDVPSRFGGEEFTTLLPNTDEEGAWLAAERIRTAVAEIKVPWDPPLPQVTISIGVCCFGYKEQLNANSVMLRADAALYVSKQQGRNRSTIWNPSMGHVEG